MFELKGNYWDICLDCLKYKIINIMKLIISKSSGSFFCRSIIQTPEPTGTKEGWLQNKLYSPELSLDKPNTELPLENCQFHFKLVLKTYK